MFGLALKLPDQRKGAQVHTAMGHSACGLCAVLCAVHTKYTDLNGNLMGKPISMYIFKKHTRNLSACYQFNRQLPKRQLSTVVEKVVSRCRAEV